MPETILIATIMRPDGETGVQAHFHSFMDWARLNNVPVNLVTPYNCPAWLVYPMFGMRRLIDPLHKAISVWWYRHWHALFLRRALKMVLSDGKQCVVYAQCPLAVDAALRARKNSDQRIVMVVHFNISQADEWAGKGMIQEGGVLYRAIRAFEADTLPRLDGLVFVSDFMRREVAARIPAVKNIPFRIVPNFLPDPGMIGDLAQPKTDLICIGTLEPRKNQRYALEIVAASVRLGRPLSLTIVGDGPDRAMLESLASQLGIGELVFFAGFVSNAAALMSNHRACLHVSRMESFGIVLIEAMARGIPVFAPAVGGVPEVFDDGAEGRLIPLDQPESAARLIVEWLDAPIILGRAREAARDRFLARFEAASVAASLAEFLTLANSQESGAAALASENTGA